MPTLFLIRHGENDFLKKNILAGHLPGVHLNERGHEQAAALARTLSLLPITAIYSSPLERAVETARPLAEAKKLEINICPALADTDVGEWAGRSWKAIQRRKIWEIIQETPSQFRFPGGESFAEAQARVVAALESIAAAHGEEDKVAVFFHADPIKLALAHYLDMPLDNFQRLAAHTGSVTVVRKNGPAVRVLASNLNPPFSFPE
ncbi:MAG: putative phosphoglycerate mutase [Anaerolineaceae bacterium]|nr:MAG: putative phosphoglycerate mutase [Anaerolineaceae bacterium]